MKTSGILQGKKTYVTAALGAIGAVAAYLTGEATLMQAGQSLWACIAAVCLRNGIENK